MARKTNSRAPQSRETNEDRSDRPNNFRDGASDAHASRTRSGKRAKRNSKTTRDTSSANSGASSNTNHYGWYVPNQDIVNDVSTTFFSYRTGDFMPVACSNWTTQPAQSGFKSLSFESSSYAMPGILWVDFVPVFGNLVDPSSAGNVAATAVYSWIRHANSGARNYDRTDLMLYLLAMDSIYAGITTCQRILSTVMMYNRWNSYTPNVLLRAMGVGSQEGIDGDLAEMRFKLNAMILKASTLAAPATMPIYDRHAYMCANVYVDEPNATAQFYLFRPQYLLKFGYDQKGAGCLNFVSMLDPAGAPKTTWRYIFSVVEDCINALYGDEDAGIMSGDILKAYGESGLVKLSTVPTDLVLTPVYDHDLLVQLHNATMHGAVYATEQSTTEKPTYDNFGIYQEIPDTNAAGPYLVNRFTVSSAIGPINPDSASHILLDLHMEPTAEAVMRSTRLMNHIVYQAGFTSDTRPQIDWLRTELGSEIVLHAYVMWYEPTSSDPMGVSSGSILSSYVPYSDLNQAMLSLLLRWQTFTLAPRLFVAPSSASGAASALLPFGQLDRVTALSFAELDRINRVALLGLFNIPRLTLNQ